MESTDDPHIAKVKDIIARTHADRNGVRWPDAATKAEAFAIHKAGTGSDLKGTCGSCNRTVMDYLRKVAGLHPLNAETSPAMHRHRLNICRGVNGDGSDACEHLAWPGLNCGKCGCFIDLKARMRRQHCPIGKW